MPTINLNKKRFEQLVGKALPLEELKDRISMLGTDLEQIEGNDITVEIFPNRPDLLSESGFARAFSSFIGVKTGLRQYPVKKNSDKVIIEPSVKDVRPFTACAIVKRLNFDDETIREIIQIQEKLHVTYGRNRKKVAIGIYPLEKIRFPITYRSDHPKIIRFRPLESEREMDALQILSQHKAGREYGHLLEGKGTFPYFIDADKNILSLPPIINSHLTGKVTESTKDLFIECSGFDFAVLSRCLNIIVTALADLGGEICSLNLEYPDKSIVSPSLDPEKIKLDLDYINRWLGLSLSEPQARTLLERMGYGYDKGFVLVPSYRADILHQVDLAEDIAIAYGYENIPEEIPQVATIAQESPFEVFCRKIRETLVGFRLLEVKNFHLLALPDLAQKMLIEDKLLTLQNALGEHNTLRHSLIPSLLKNLADNQHNEYPQNIFEIGRTFSKEKDFKSDTGIKETEHLALLLCHDQADFTEIRQIVDALISSLGLPLSVKESSHPSFIPGRLGDLYVNEQKIGIIGELHPQVIVNWNLSLPVVGAEIDLENVYSLLNKEN
jgi:phenylalanyl-tRNA synthetase beta chain